MPEDDDLHPLVPNNDMNDLDSVALEMPEPPEPPRRQRAVAQVRPIVISDVARDIAGRHPFQAVEEMDATCLVLVSKLDLTVQHAQTLTARHIRRLKKGKWGWLQDVVC